MQTCSGFDQDCPISLKMYGVSSFSMAKKILKTLSQKPYDQLSLGKRKKEMDKNIHGTTALPTGNMLLLVCQNNGVFLLILFILYPGVCSLNPLLLVSCDVYLQKVCIPFLSPTPSQTAHKAVSGNNSILSPEMFLAINLNVKTHLCPVVTKPAAACVISLLMYFILLFR